jgi:hypothetical protein
VFILYKKFLLLILCVGLLTGCSDGQTSSYDSDISKEVFEDAKELFIMTENAFKEMVDTGDSNISDRLKESEKINILAVKYKEENGANINKKEEKLIVDAINLHVLLMNYDLARNGSDLIEDSEDEILNNYMKKYNELKEMFD